MKVSPKKRKNKESPPLQWCVYILLCKNGHYYTGMTNNLERRFKQHKSGHGGRYTRVFGVKRLLYSEPCQSRSDALKREAAIKVLPKNKKIALVKSLKENAKSHKLI